MSAAISSFKEWVFTFQKRFVINLLLLRTWESVVYLPVVEAFENQAFNIPCVSDSNCSVIIGKAVCDIESNFCVCANGSVRMHQHDYCLSYVNMGDDCQVHAQCMHADLNIECHRWTNRCRCRTGYMYKERNNTKICVKTRLLENEPYIVHIFSGLGPVHIVLGCLTGGLALLACFAGIIQLVRKKYMRRTCDGMYSSEFSPELGYSTTTAPSQPFSDSQFTTTPPSCGDFACGDSNSTAPPTPGTLGDEEYVVTPPPTYEEAVKCDREKAASVITV